MPHGHELSPSNQHTSRAMANNTPRGGVSKPAVVPIQYKEAEAPVQTTALPPVQFTLDDAQELWKGWYGSRKRVSESRILDYITARKRGWLDLRRALRRPGEATPVIEGEEDPIRENNTRPKKKKRLLSNNNNEEEEEEILLPSSMEVVNQEEKGNNGEVEDNGPEIAEQDVVLYRAIEKKQEAPVSEREQKLETDKRKYDTVRKLVQESFSGENENESGLEEALRTFYVKNAPVGYNTSVPDDEEEQSYVYKYDVRNERDFSLGLAEDALTDSREETDYFRAPFKRKHQVRKKQDNEVRKYLKSRHKKKVDDIKSKQVYMSFYVAQEEGSLFIKNVGSSYTSTNMLGSKSGKTILQHKVDIGGHELMLWVNQDSAGHQSRYNASAIVPNLIQYQKIMDTLKANPRISGLGSVDPGKTFRSSTRKAVLKEGTEELPSKNYKQDMLNDRRKLVQALSTTINNLASKKYIKAITVDDESDFLPYPCLVIQPLSNYEKDFKVDKKELVDQLKRDIVLTLHEKYKISFANRASFGFAYPTVGDVSVSVRIWPGLIPGTLFSNIILNVLASYGLLDRKPEDEGPVVDSKGENEPLVLALKLAIIRAQKRYAKFLEIKKRGTPIVSRTIYKWVNNRITSNVIKAKKLVTLLTDAPHDLEVIRRAVRTLENLNEYELIQAGAEEDNFTTKDTEGTRKSALLEQFKRRSGERQVVGWELVSETIRSSGMDAYRVALETTGDTQEKSARLYFETDKVNKEIAKRPKGLRKYGAITKMQDPSYNFVSQEDLDKKVYYKWKNKTDLPSVHIYDITNTPILTAFSKVRHPSRPDPDVVIFFESLSKHFQFGMDKTTLGRLIVYVNVERKDMEGVKTLIARFGQVKDTPLPNAFLNFMVSQNELFGE